MVNADSPISHTYEWGHTRGSRPARSKVPRYTKPEWDLWLPGKNDIQLMKAPARLTDDWGHHQGNSLARPKVLRLRKNVTTSLNYRASHRMPKVCARPFPFF